MSSITTWLRPATFTAALATLPLLSALTGCGSNDAAAIQAIQALNAPYKAEGKASPTLVVPDGEYVATIYIQSNADDYVPHLKGLSKVKEISVIGFEDKHIEYLPSCSALNSLVLGDAKVTDAGVAEIAGILKGTKVQSLTVDEAPITFASLGPIAEIETLLTLNLTGTNVADDLTPLSGLKNVQWLLLRDMDLSQLSQASIETIAALPELRRLTVTDTGISNDAVTQIKKAKPGLNLETSHAVDPVEALANPEQP